MKADGKTGYGCVCLLYTPSGSTAASIDEFTFFMFRLYPQFFISVAPLNVENISYSMETYCGVDVITIKVHFGRELMRERERETKPVMLSGARCIAAVMVCFEN